MHSPAGKERNASWNDSVGGAELLTMCLKQRRVQRRSGEQEA